MLKVFDSVLLALNRLLMTATSALILAMAAVVTADVIGRNLALFALPWSAEFSEYGLYLSSVLIAPWLLRHGQHISVGVLVDALPPRVGWVVGVLGNLLCATVSAILGWYALQATLRSRSDQALVIKNVVFPEWWVLVPITFIFFLLTVEFLVQCTRGRSAPGDLPV